MLVEDDTHAVGLRLALGEHDGLDGPLREPLEHRRDGPPGAPSVAIPLGREEGDGGKRSASKFDQEGGGGTRGLQAGRGGVERGGDGAAVCGGRA